VKNFRANSVFRASASCPKILNCEKVLNANAVYIHLGVIRAIWASAGVLNVFSPVYPLSAS